MTRRRGAFAALSFVALFALGCGNDGAEDPASPKPDCSDDAGDLRLWTLDIDHPDYVTLKNTGACPIDLEGLEILFDDHDEGFPETGIDCTLRLPELTLPAGSSVRVCELPLPGDIDARATKLEGCPYDLPFFPDRGGATYLCRGHCDASTLLDVVVHAGNGLDPTYGDPPPPRFGMTFAAPLNGVTLENSAWARYQRVDTEGRFPDYLDSDWGLQNRTLFADFETGISAESFDAAPVPWSTIPREFTEVTTTDETAMSGVASLRIEHLTEDGFSSELSQIVSASGMPRDIAYFARLSGPTSAGGFFEVLSQGTPALRIGFAEEGLGASMRDAHTPFVPDAWYLVELRDADWIARRFDLYVDGVLLGRNISVFEDAHLPDEVRLFTYGAGSAYFDAIELWGAATPSP